MHTRDASGRQVSLLNDEQPRPSLYSLPSYSSYEIPHMRRADSYVSAVSGSPRTPDLLRADSYDSQISNGGHSPSTPGSMNDYGRQSYSAYPDPTQYENRGPIYGSYQEQKRMPVLPMVRPAYERPNSFESESYAAIQADRSSGGKRYPCRFKDSHGCDKTFTTSGHASRHSKIHTAEKAVHCSFAGCTKKFTRADNMKQHLETHYKERSRATASAKAAPTKLTMPSGVKKSSSGSRISRPSSRLSQRQSYESYPTYPSPHQAAYSPLASPISTTEDGPYSRIPPPMHSRTSSDSYALDTLAALCSSDRM